MDTANRLPVPERDWALFLDVDGTLVEIVPDPEAVRVAPRVIDLLGRLNATLDGAVALVSGRTLDKLDRLFAPLRLAAAGNHGLERRTAGGRIIRPARPAPEMEKVRAAFAAFAERDRGLYVEDKTLSVALHCRRAPAYEAEVARLAERLAAEIGPGFRVQHGKHMAEIRPLGGDKGTVVEAFMAEPPFAGRLPVFVGDDVTDEDGFAAVNRLGGISIRVGDGAETLARWRIGEVDALLDWLAPLAAAARAGT